MTSFADSYDVIIAGAGPSGSSAAIHLANGGVKVLLVEQKEFPRAKLCGEFVSPECQSHFERLGVDAAMIATGPAHLRKTVFYSSKGQGITVPSEWLRPDAAALGISRAEMDNNLLNGAKKVGVDVLENANVSALLREGTRVSGIRLESKSRPAEYRALVTIDATGRTRALVRRINKNHHHRKVRPRLVAFKAHLENTRVADGACEIYSYPGGYGGLSSIEGKLSNLCFIAAAKDVRGCDSDPERVVRRVVSQNRRAAYTLAPASPRTEWLSVALESFGRHRLVPAEGLVAIGDAAAFIDPFTGSGMLMALESGELVAASIVRHLNNLRHGSSFADLTREYRAQYRKKFDSRLRISSLLRRVAFFPHAAEAAILLFSASDRLRRRLAYATRSGAGQGESVKITN